ncbi:MAG: hypothetical protein NZZ41_01535, partial [Candidatus Dojkabacteria bacterium]|nr:hypothetical protein [Candidatus Dojkabacteria bacterium]
IDRISNVDGKNIILVIPTSSLLLSSIVNLKVLFRKIVKLNKNVILVTEDKYGFVAAQRAGFVVVQKISQITKQLWDIAFDKLIRQKNLILSTSRQIQAENQSNENYPIENATKLDTSNSTSITTSDLNNDSSTEDLQNTQSSYEEVVKNNVNSSKETVYSQTTSETSLCSNLDSSNDKSYEQDTTLARKNIDELKFKLPQRKVKIVNLDGVDLVIGGDARNYLNKEAENDNISLQDNLTTDMIEKKQNVFVGTDLSRFLKKKSFFHGISSFFTRRKTRRSDLDEEKKNKKLNLKILFLLILSSITVISIFAYSLYLNVHSVDVVITLAEEGKKTLTDKFIKGKLNYSKVDYDTLTVPLVEFTVDKIGTTGNGQATGTKQIGNKAKGLVTFYNTTSPPTSIKLTKGTKLKHTTTGLTFLLVSDITLQPPTIGSAGEVIPSILEDVEVEAEDIGEKYNLQVNSGSTIKFTAEGFSTTQIDITGFSSFTGGSSREVRFVSQQNYQDLYDTLLKQLLQSAELRLTSLAPTGFTLINNSLTHSVDQAVSFPKVNDISEDGLFNLNIEISVKAFFTNNDYLISLARYLLLLEKEENVNIDITDIDDVKVSLVSFNKDVNDLYQLKLSSTGKFKVVIDIEQLKNNIKGMKLSEAYEFIKQDKNIKNLRIFYQPFFIPEELRIIPQDVQKINVRFM